MNADQRVKLKLGDQFVQIEFLEDQVADLTSQVATLRAALAETATKLSASENRVRALEAEAMSPPRPLGRQADLRPRHRL